MRLCSEPRLPAENKVTTSICIGKYKKSIALRINDWKAIRPNKNLPFELYDLSKDIEEVHDVAGQFPDVIKKVTTYAKKAHAPVRLGKVINASLGFNGHKKD